MLETGMMVTDGTAEQNVSRWEEIQRHKRSENGLVKTSASTVPFVTLLQRFERICSPGCGPLVRTECEEDVQR